MKNTRRLKRMARNKGVIASLSLTSLMDVFTILVLYLLVNQSSGVTLDPPKSIKLPSSVVQSQPKLTVVMTVIGENIFIQNEPVITVAEVITSKEDSLEAIKVRLQQVNKDKTGIETQAEDDSNEITILADRSVPFKLLKKLMTSSASAGYSKISLAVNQKASQN